MGDDGRELVVNFYILWGSKASGSRSPRVVTEKNNNNNKVLAFRRKALPRKGVCVHTEKRG